MKTISTKKKKKNKERKENHFFSPYHRFWLRTFKAVRKKWESGGMKAALPNIYDSCPTYKFKWIT